MHQSVADAEGLTLVHGAPGEARYLSYLVRHFGFEAPLESALAVTPGIFDVIDIQARRKSAALVHDLVELGVPLDRIIEVPHAHIAAFCDLREALGWLYVSERLAATHSIVARELVRRAPALEPSTQCFGCYDSFGGRDDVARAIEAVAATPGDEDAILEAVLRAFDHQHDWMRPERPSASTLAVVTTRALAR